MKQKQEIKWWLLYIREFFSAFFFWMVFPYMINFLIDKVGTIEATIIMSLFGIFSILTTLFIGNLADIIGSMKAISYSTIMRIGLIFLMIISLVLKIYTLFGLFYVLQAIPNSIFMPSLNALIYKLADDEKDIQKKSTNNYIALNIAALISPALGALLFNDFLMEILWITIIFEVLQLYIFNKNFNFVIFKKHTTYSFISNLNLYKNALFNKQVIFFGIIIIFTAFVNMGFIDNVQNIYILRFTKGLNILNYHLSPELSISAMLVLNATVVILLGKLLANVTSKMTISKIIFILLIIFLTIGSILLIGNLTSLIIAAVFIPIAEVLLPGLQSRFVYKVSDEKTQSLYSSSVSLYTSLGTSINSFLLIILINYKLRGIGITYIIVAMLGFVVLHLLNKILNNENV